MLCAFVLTLFSCENDDDAPMVAQCAIPTALSTSNITFSSATLNWNDSNNAEDYSIEYGISGFSAGTGTTVFSTTPSIEITNLLANTSYDFYVQIECDIDNQSLLSDVQSFTTLAAPVVAEFLQNLSELNLYAGNLADLVPSPYASEYELNTTLFSDYAHKERLIALPLGASMQYNDSGLPNFPNNTVIAKTFYYNNDERDLSLGRQIIETRVLIKKEDGWQTGDYVWNASQTEATLDLEGGDVLISWIDGDGESQSITYNIPSNNDCFTCHQNSDDVTPIGPKLRMLNFERNGQNQLQSFIDSGYLEGITSASEVTVVPNWLDTSYSMEERARAYLDINCAHCHIDGGFCDDQSTLRLDFETLFENTNILQRKNSINARISSFQTGFSMPFIGTTILHDEGVALIQLYLDNLD